MFELVLRAVFISIIYGVVVCLLDKDDEASLIMRNAVRLIFLIMAIAIGSKLGIYIQ